MPKKTTAIHPVDAYAGQRLKEARKLRGMSCKQLGSLLSQPVSFQQIQKYEQGLNRIAISRMYEFMKALQLPLTYFLPEGMEIPLPVYSNDERMLLHHYRSLSCDMQVALLVFVSNRANEIKEKEKA